MRKWASKLFAKPSEDRSSEQRIIWLNNPRGHLDFCNNRIDSTKYNLFTFLPLSFWGQFQRPINAYFLLVAALQCIPSVAVVSPLTTVFPIVVAFLINAVREGVDDVRRHRQDRELNERLYQRVVGDTQEVEVVTSANICVGDVLVLHPFEIVPCDVAVLLTSHDDGSAYVTTESLDGETAAKRRVALLHHVFHSTSAAASPEPPKPEVSEPHTGLVSTEGPSKGGMLSTRANQPRMTCMGDTVLPCCRTIEQHELHCLRFVFDLRLRLTSEGPNTHLHSYRGSAFVSALDSSPEMLSAQNVASSALDDDLAALESHIVRDLPRSVLNISPALPPPACAATPPTSASREEDSIVEVGLPRPLSVPEVLPMTLRETIVRPPRPANNTLDRGGTEEHLSLLDADGLISTDVLPVDPLSLHGEVHALHCFKGPDQTLPLGIDNVIYASSCTGNTHFIICIAIFTGRETKTNMSRRVPPTKWATIDNLFNRLTLFIFLLQLILVFVCSLLSWLHLRSDASRWYLGITPGSLPFTEYFSVMPLRFLMMLSPMVPLSFKVMVDISKAYVSSVILWDDDMRAMDKPASVNNSALAEELGQVEYVLSDKTGTLTANLMTFHTLATASTLIFSDDTEDCCGVDVCLRRPLAEVAQAFKATTARGGREDYYLMLTMLCCNTIERTLLPSLSSEISGTFSLHSAANNSMNAAANASVASRWMSSSPDEVALIDGAEQCGFALLQRSHTLAKVGLWGEAGASLAVEVLHTLPFSSDRGMMSVLLRCPPVPVENGKEALAQGDADEAAAAACAAHQKYVLLTKGADERLLPLCSALRVGTQLNKIRNQLVCFARKGLRTLVYGYRVLSEEETGEALRLLRTVESNVSPAATREKELQHVYAQLERDLTYCGCTAVRDELQDGVPETLAQLRHANIRVWMLTGDKTETAKQTAMSCGLIRPVDHVVTLTPPTEESLSPSEHLSYVLSKLSEIAERRGDRKGQAPSGMAVRSRREKLRLWCQTYLWELSGLEDFVHEFTQPATCEQVRPIDHPLVTQPCSAVEALYGPVSRRVREMASTMGCGIKGKPGVYFGPCSPSATPSVRAGGLDHGYCVALSGRTLRLLEKEEEASQGSSPMVHLLRECLLGARAVVCSRTAPALKSYVVKLVRSSGHVTLAIGDGGNDVPMLQAANVGVGIKGREGSQAKLASDFAIGQFRFLSKLILVHGHTACERTSMIVQQSFWKTVLIAWVQVLFNISTDFSGVSFWDALSLMLYNATVTVPVTFLCVMDMPLSHWILRTTPQLYCMSQRGRYLSATTFYGYIARAFLHGTIAYTLSVALQKGSGAILDHGWVMDRGGDFYAAYIAVVTAHAYTVLTESHAITFAHWVCFLFCAGNCFFSFWVYARAPMSPNSTFVVLVSSPSFYLSYLGIVTTVCGSLAIYAVAKVLWFPDALQLQRLLLVHLRKVRKGRNRLALLALQTFFQEDNPSHFWTSISPYHALHYSPLPLQSFVVPSEEEEEAGWA